MVRFSWRVGPLLLTPMVREISEWLRMTLKTYETDIVMMYCFGRCDKRLGKSESPLYMQNPDSFLEAEDFDPSYRDASFFGSTAGNFMRHAPWANNLLQALPMWITESIHPAMATFVAQKRASAPPASQTAAIANTNVGCLRTNKTYPSGTQRSIQGP
jgi:hypothetical protein